MALDELPQAFQKISINICRNVPHDAANLVQHFMVTIKTCWLMRVQESEGDERGENANDAKISPGG